MEIAMTITTTSTSSNPLLQALLNQLSATTNTSTGTASSTLASTLVATPSTAGSAAPVTLNAAARPGLTSDILYLLMQQVESGSAGAGSSTGAPASSAAASPVDGAPAAASPSPVQALFAAIDSNGNGTISQSELEKFIEAAGGTQSQADALYAQLDPSGSGSVSEATLAADLKSGHGQFHHHHPLDGRHGNILGMLNTQSPAQLASNMVSAMDSNGDGVVSQTELTNFVTQNGGTAAQANALFSALDTSGSTTLTASDFQNLITNLGLGSFASASNAYLAAASGVSASPVTTATTTVQA
jgi:Ca2+-binding EF-hand superfamily protein